MEHNPAPAAPAAESAPVLSVRGLSKSFPIKQSLWEAALRKPQKAVRAVDNVSFFIGNGETMGLVGESGCGKSTLSKTLIRLYKPDTGSILFEGQDFAKLEGRALRDARRKIQMVFQDPYSSLNPRMNIRSMLREVLAVHHVCPASEMDDRIDALLRMVGMDSSMADRYPGEFSGGQRQRIGIARALAVVPDFLIADEPVSALDVSIQAQVINLLSELQEKLRLTLLFISHDLRMVRHITHRVAVMYLGRIVEIAPTEELFNRPFHPYSEILIKAAPALDPRSRSDESAISGEPSSPIDLPNGCRFCARCPFTTAECKQTEPELIDVGGGRMLACFHPRNGG